MNVCPVCGKECENNVCENCNATIKAAEQNSKEAEILERVEKLEQQSVKYMKSISSSAAIIAVLALINLFIGFFTMVLR